MIAIHLVDFGESADSEQSDTDPRISLDILVQVFKESVLITQSGQCIDMSLYAVVANIADKIVGFAGGISYHDAAAGTHIVFSRDAPRPILHIMVSGTPGENLVYALMISCPILGMDLVFPDVSRAIHVLRRHTKRIHCVFGPA